MFFKYQDDVLLNGKVVTTPTFELTLETKNNFTYPIDGWYWFDTIEQAYAHFGITNQTVSE